MPLILLNYIFYITTIIEKERRCDFEENHLLRLFFTYDCMTLSAMPSFL